MNKITLDKKKSLYIIGSIVLLFAIALTSMKMGSLDISYGEIIKGILKNSTTFCYYKRFEIPKSYNCHLSRWKLSHMWCAFTSCC